MFLPCEPQDQNILDAGVGAGGFLGTRVFFVTSRNGLKSGGSAVGFGNHFHQMELHGLRGGKATVDITEDDAKTCRFASDEDISLIDLVVYPGVIQGPPEHCHPRSNRLFADLHRILRDEQKDLILYVHGYDTRFKEALWSAAQIQLRCNRVLEDLLDNKASAPHLACCPRGFETLAISWPSDGKRLSHRRDLHAALRSSRAFGRALPQARDPAERRHGSPIGDSFHLAACPAENLPEAMAHKLACPRRVHVIIENSASDTFSSEFEDVLTGGRYVGSLPKLFGQVFMTEADEDSAVVEAGDGHE